MDIYGVERRLIMYRHFHDMEAKTHEYYVLQRKAKFLWWKVWVDETVTIPFAGTVPLSGNLEWAKKIAMHYDILVPHVPGEPVDR